MRIETLITIIEATAMLTVAATSSAQLNLAQPISYQGFLVEDTGAVTGSYQIQFSIWDDSTGGTQLWTETHPSVPVSSGLFSLMLGSIVAIPVDSFLPVSPDLFLEVQIGADPPISPRSRLGSVPTAGIAQRIIGDVRTSPGTIVSAWEDGEHQVGASLVVDSGGAGLVMYDTTPGKVGEISFTPDTAGSYADMLWEDLSRRATINLRTDSGGAGLIMRDTIPEKVGEISFLSGRDGSDINVVWEDMDRQVKVSLGVDSTGGSLIIGDSNRSVIILNNAGLTLITDTSGRAIAQQSISLIDTFGDTLANVSASGVYSSGPVRSGNSLILNGPADQLETSSGEMYLGREEVTGAFSDVMVSVGHKTPTEMLDVAGTVKMDGFKLPTGATAGYVLTSDANGSGTWQAGGGGGNDNDWELGTTNNDVLFTFGRWGIARKGNTLYGSGDSTHVNLGQNNTTGSNGQDYMWCTIGGGFENRARGQSSTIGGGVNNDVWLNTIGGVIGGGNANDVLGTYGTISGGQTNAADFYSSVGGGSYNTASGNFSVVGGGDHDTAKAVFGGVFSGYSNLAGDNSTDTATFVGGGYNNSATAKFSTVSGGQNNNASATRAAIGGGSYNTASGSDAVVSGGTGNSATSSGAVVGGGVYNDATGWRATVGGGDSCKAIHDYTTVSGGHMNVASDTGATVGGGRQNIASGMFASVSGGKNNNAAGAWATVGGGSSNTSSGTHTTIGGGEGNIANANISTVGGGWMNEASAHGATVAGGDSCIASGNRSAIGGGLDNTASGWTSTIGGGSHNRARGDYSVVGGGGGPDKLDSNLALGLQSTIAGGIGNRATNIWTSIGGGVRNSASSPAATIAGGWENSASGQNSTIGGGAYDTAAGYGSTISGGENNRTSAVGLRATISGGYLNTADSAYTVVTGGYKNRALSTYASVGGGDQDSALGFYSTVPGGSLNRALGDYSFAAGQRAKADHSGTFVWGDDTNADFASTGNNQFLIRASGGVGINNNNPSYDLDVTGTIGGSGGLYHSSDIRWKKNIRTLTDALGQVSKLRGVNYEWRREEYPKEHFTEGNQIGFIAQEVSEVLPEVVMQRSDGFYSVDYAKLTPILVEAIKEQQKTIQSQKHELSELRNETTNLESRFAELKALVQTLIDEKRGVGGSTDLASKQ